MPTLSHGSSTRLTGLNGPALQQDSEALGAEIKSLRASIRDMVVLSTLPATWNKLDGQGIAQSLAERLVASLGADVVYVRVKMAEGQLVEALETGDAGLTLEQTAALCAALAPRAVPATPGRMPAVRNPISQSDLNIAAAPIVFEGGQGAVVAGAARGEFPARGERLLLSFAANQAAIAFTRKRADDERAALVALEERRAAQLHRLLEAALLISRNPSIDDLLQQVTDQARGIVGAHQAMAVITPEVDGPKEIQALSLSSKYRAWTDSEESVSAPLIGRGDRHLGTIRLADKTEGRFTPEDQAVLMHLAHIAAAAIENARLFSTLEEQMGSHVQLNSALRRALDDRDRAVAELRQALQTREEFLSSAAHDLRTPVASIKGMAQLLRRRAAVSLSADEDRFTEGLEDIDRSADRMVDLIEELLDLARLGSDRPLELQLRDADLVALATEAVRARESTARLHGLRMDTDLPELRGRWDATRLLRVLNNLLDNALKYSPKGGEVVVVVCQEGDCAVLSVRDQGIGIPAQDLPHLFERFYRGTNVVGVVPGTGIGLTGARYIVESHGGTIEVESAEGKGSVFTIRLPVTIP